MALTVEGLNIVQIDVQGRGFLSGILRFMVNNMNLNSTYNVTFNFTTCLPKPNQPDYSTAVGILFLYVIALLCTLLQGYGKRVRRKNRLIILSRTGSGENSLPARKNHPRKVDFHGMDEGARVQEKEGARSNGTRDITRIFGQSVPVL